MIAFVTGFLVGVAASVMVGALLVIGGVRPPRPRD